MNSSNNVATLAGRILLSAIFIFAGIGKIAAFSGPVGYAVGAHANAVGGNCGGTRG